MVTYIGPGQKGGVGDVKLEAIGLEGRAAGRGLVLASLAKIRVVPVMNNQIMVQLNLQNSIRRQ